MGTRLINMRTTYRKLTGRGLTDGTAQPQKIKYMYIALEVDRISVSVSAPNVDKWALLADIRFRPKVVVSHSLHVRFRQAAVGKFGGCRK